MAIIIESTINYETGELISCEVVGTSDRQPIKSFVAMLEDRWWAEVFAKQKKEAAR